jgi:hypothetical protein
VIQKPLFLSGGENDRFLFSDLKPGDLVITNEARGRLVLSIEFIPLGNCCRITWMQLWKTPADPVQCVYSVAYDLFASFDLASRTVVPGNS